MEANSKSFEDRVAWAAWEKTAVILLLMAGLGLALVTMTFKPLLLCIVYPVVRGMAVSAEWRTETRRRNHAKAAGVNTTQIADWSDSGADSIRPFGSGKGNPNP